MINELSESVMVSLSAIYGMLGGNASSETTKNEWIKTIFQC